MGLHIWPKVEKQGLHLGTAFFGLHLGARGLHLGARGLHRGVGITSRGKGITSWASNYISRQVLHLGARIVYRSTTSCLKLLKAYFIGALYRLFRSNLKIRNMMINCISLCCTLFTEWLNTKLSKEVVSINNLVSDQLFKFSRYSHVIGVQTPKPAQFLLIYFFIYFFIFFLFSFFF